MIRVLAIALALLSIVTGTSKAQQTPQEIAETRQTEALTAYYALVVEIEPLSMLYNNAYGYHDVRERLDNNYEYLYLISYGPGGEGGLPNAAIVDIEYHVEQYESAMELAGQIEMVAESEEASGDAQYNWGLYCMSLGQYTAAAEAFFDAKIYYGLARIDRELQGYYLIEAHSHGRAAHELLSTYYC